MSRQKRSRPRKQKTFGSLPWSNVKGNANEFVSKVGPQFVARVSERRSKLGQRLDSCEPVGLSQKEA
jgi:hypothetical protein